MIQRNDRGYKEITSALGHIFYHRRLGILNNLKRHKKQKKEFEKIKKENTTLKEETSALKRE